jgi:hypothetical protein
VAGGDMKTVIVTSGYIRAKDIARARGVFPGYYAIVRKTPDHIYLGLDKALVIIDASARLDCEQREAVRYLTERGAEVETFSL